MKHRVRYCDLLRFIAIISVILIHVVADFRQLYLLENRNYYFLFTIVDSLARTGVPLFFMFTGIFLLSSKKEEKYSEFVKKVVKKLVVPLIVVSFIYYIYDCWALESTSFSLFDFVTGLYSNKIKYHLWYMYSIILIYLLIPFLRVVIQHLKKKELRNLIILIFVLGFCTSTLTQFCTYFELPTFEGISYPTILTQINYLFLGYYLYKYKVAERLRRPLYVLGIISFICIPILDYILMTGVRWEPFSPPERIFPFFMAIALFVFVKENYDKWHVSEKLEKFFALLASLSLHIYLLHVLVLEFSRKVIYYFITPVGLWQNLLMFICLLLITSVGTFTLSYTLKKIILFCKEKVNKKIDNSLVSV